MKYSDYLSSRTIYPLTNCVRPVVSSKIFNKSKSPQFKAKISFKIIFCELSAKNQKGNEF